MEDVYLTFLISGEVNIKNFNSLEVQIKRGLEMVNVVAGPHGNLVDYTFPTTCVVNTYEAIHGDVHNDGDASGTILLGFANYSGPGDMIVKFAGVEHVVHPGEVYWIQGVANPCEHVIADGEVKFTATGSYVVWVIGGHTEPTDGGTSYVIDTHVELDG